MIVSYPTVEVKHMWQVYVKIELKIKLFCFFIIRAMGWIFIAVRKQIFKSFGCTKIRNDTKYTKTRLSKVMQPKTSSNDSDQFFLPCPRWGRFWQSFYWRKNHFEDELHFLSTYNSAKTKRDVASHSHLLEITSMSLLLLSMPGQHQDILFYRRFLEI